MKVCAVSSCRSTSARNPKLNFFGIPKDLSVREEWSEVLSLPHMDENTRICERHFRARDFCAGSRKTIKVRAVPALRIDKLGDEHSDEDLMQIDGGSGSDPEIVEIKKVSKSPVGSSAKLKGGIKIKCEPVESVKQEPSSQVSPPLSESEPGRRPSRRAAQLAVQKIHDSVRQYALTDSSAVNTVSHAVSPVKTEHKPRKVVPTPRPATKRAKDQKEWHSIRAPRPDISLLMECHEELLSPVQAEAILKAQLEYNAVMKKLRNLKASNARIVCTYNEDSEFPPKSPGTIIPTLPSSQPQKIANVVALNPTGAATSSPNTFTVVPVRLVTVHSQPLMPPPFHVMNPGSPAFIAADIITTT